MNVSKSVGAVLVVVSFSDKTLLFVFEIPKINQSLRSTVNSFN